MIVNLHRVNTKNIGDLMCAPYRYFAFLQNSPVLDLIGFKEGESPTLDDRKEWAKQVAQAGALIIGGGGLLGTDFFAGGFRRVQSERSTASKAIIWGAGHNDWKIGDWRKLKAVHDVDAQNFDLIGVRDYNSGYEWVPCVSCMSPELDEFSGVEIVHEVGMYAHSGTMKNPKLLDRIPRNLPTLSNDGELRPVLKFLASCETVLTDSFHGMYWATLMGRKVIAFPSSSKFYSAKHPVPLCAPEDWQSRMRMAHTYPEALQECRQANAAFADKVANLIGV
jgi:hypothetical protein